MYALAIDKYMKIEKCSRLVAQANMDAYFQVLFNCYQTYLCLYQLIIPFTHIGAHLRRHLYLFRIQVSFT